MASQTLYEVDAEEIRSSTGIWGRWSPPVFQGQSSGRGSRGQNARPKTIFSILKPHSAIVLWRYFRQFKKLENCTVWKEFGRHMIITYGVGKEKSQAICTLKEVLLRVCWCPHIYSANITITDFWLTYSKLGSSNYTIQYNTIQYIYSN